MLVEGEHSSLDKQTYGAILRNRFPNLVLVPSGGKSTLQSFSLIQEKVLNHTLWGVDFFMLCDRDAVPVNAESSAIERSSQGRLRVLPRYHLENYFLDETVIAHIFAQLEPENSWLCDPAAIREKLQEIARGYISYAAALIVSSLFRERAGNMDIMPKGAHSKSAEELAEAMCSKAEHEKDRINTANDPDKIRMVLHDTIVELEATFDEGDAWKRAIPGRPILQTFCGSGSANMDFGRFKMAFLKAAEEASTDPFAEVVEIFEKFSAHQVT